MTIRLSLVEGLGAPLAPECQFELSGGGSRLQDGRVEAGAKQQGVERKEDRQGGETGGNSAGSVGWRLEDWSRSLGP